MPSIGKRREGYTPPRLSPAQMRKLEACINDSPDARADIKPLFLWMLRHTDGFRRPVRLTLREDEDGAELAKAFQFAAHDMISANGKTHLNDLCQKLGTEVGISHHQLGLRHTVWFSDLYYDLTAEELYRVPENVRSEIRKIWKSKEPDYSHAAKQAVCWASERIFSDDLNAQVDIAISAGRLAEQLRHKEADAFVGLLRKSY